MGPKARVVEWVRSPMADVVLALSVAAHSQVEIWWPALALGGAETGGAKSLLVPTALVSTLPLAMRRRYPFWVLCFVAAAMSAQAVLTTPPEGLSGVLAIVVAAYSVAAHRGGRPALVGLVIGLATSLVISGDMADFAFLAFVTAAPWLAGRELRSSRLHAHSLEKLTAQLASQRDERERLAVVEERARIARELHDVVAHNVSTMVVQAEAGEALLDDTERAREAFQAIQASGREALTEMRRALGLLRRGDHELALVPQPGLTHLDKLLGRVREAGLLVELDIEGEPRPLAPGLDVSAYRTVQEALTNTLKHSDGDRAWVTVRYGDRALEVYVADNGGFDGSLVDGGYGITGMRERARLFGGDVETGRGADGGFSVRAWMPYEA